MCELASPVPTVPMDRNYDVTQFALLSLKFGSKLFYSNKTNIEDQRTGFPNSIPEDGLLTFLWMVPAKQLTGAQRQPPTYSSYPP